MFHSRRQRRKKDRSGATLIETAVVLPVFFTLLFGFIEFGHCFMTIHTLNSAARKAARLGVGESATTNPKISHTECTKPPQRA